MMLWCLRALGVGLDKFGGCGVRRALTIYDGALGRQSSMTVLNGARAL